MITFGNFTTATASLKRTFTPGGRWTRIALGGGQRVETLNSLLQDLRHKTERPLTQGYPGRSF